MLWTTLIVLGSLVAIIAGYVYWQYRTARPPALDSIPIYSASAAVPVTAIPAPQLADAETQLRTVAANAQPGYRVADERFLATKGPFVWDAVRHHIGPRLGSAGYTLADDGSSADHTIWYSLYTHTGWLRPRFNNDAILAAGLLQTTIRTATGDPVYVYGYFRLTTSK
jgi:hypothetical protein